MHKILFCFSWLANLDSNLEISVRSKLMKVKPLQNVSHHWVQQIHAWSLNTVDYPVTDFFLIGWLQTNPSGSEQYVFWWSQFLCHKDYSSHAIPRFISFFFDFHVLQRTCRLITYLFVCQVCWIYSDLTSNIRIVAMFVTASLQINNAQVSSCSIRKSFAWLVSIVYYRHKTETYIKYLHVSTVHSPQIRP